METYNVAKEIFILSNKLKRYLDKMYSKKDLFSGQARILKFLYNYKDENVYQKDIENEFQIRGGTVTGIIDSLVKQNYIDRIESIEDKRKRLIVLTPLGEEKAKIAIKTTLFVEDAIRETLNKNEQATLRKTIGKINKMIDEGEENEEFI